MTDLCGLKVLIVEDEGMIALLIEDMLSELGCEIVASAMRLSKAIQLADEATIDLAVLDVNLDGEFIYPVARTLVDRGIPFVFSTGYGVEGLPAEFSGRPTVNKPFEISALRSAIERALSQSVI